MIALGIVLFILGIFFSHALFVIGIALIVIGLVLNVVPIGGYRGPFRGRWY